MNNIIHYIAEKVKKEKEAKINNFHIFLFFWLQRFFTQLSTTGLGWLLQLVSLKAYNFKSGAGSDRKPCS